LCRAAGGRVAGRRPGRAPAVLGTWRALNHPELTGSARAPDHFCRLGRTSTARSARRYRLPPGRAALRHCQQPARVRPARVGAGRSARAPGTAVTRA
jgi:hypothetical protein